MKKVVIVVPDGYANLSSITGAYQILIRANAYWEKLSKKSLMEVFIAGYVKELTLDEGFFSIRPKALDDIGNADLVIIPSVSHEYEKVLKDNTTLVAWVRHQYECGAEIASICTGAFILAATGLLDGKTCSTHWNAANAFRLMFPDIDLQPDKLLTIGQRLYTNGGAYSFLNLMLFLVEKYFDKPTAIFCSKVFQIDIERNSQSPFSIFQAQKNHGDDMVCKAQAYLEENISEKISFADLALKLAVSRRNFDRRFIKAVGKTPVEYMQLVKIEAAKNTLENERKSIYEVMNEVGYSDNKAFREVFKKITGLSPMDYRARYHQEVVSGWTSKSSGI